MDGEVTVLSVEQGVQFSQKLDILEGGVSSILRSQISFKQMKVGANSEHLFVLGQSSDDKYTLGVFKVQLHEKHLGMIAGLERLELIHVNKQVFEKYAIGNLCQIRIDFDSRFEVLLLRVDHLMIVLKLDPQKGRLVEKMSYLYDSESQVMDHNLVEHPSKKNSFLSVSIRERIPGQKIFEFVDLDVIGGY